MRKMNLRPLPFFKGIILSKRILLYLIEIKLSIVTKKDFEPTYFEKYYTKHYEKSIKSLLNFVLSDSIFKIPINLGLSHGVSGILLVLSLIYKNKSDILLKRAIYKILSFLIDIDLKNIPLPSIIYKEKNTYAKVKPSWCYSELGIYHSIIISSKCMGLYSISCLYKHKIMNVINKIENHKIISPNFCHGYSGILVFNKLYNNNSYKIKKYYMDLLYKERSNDITSIFYDYYYAKEMIIKKETNLSFLDGSFSVLLSLMFINGYQNKLWEKLLLIRFTNDNI